jgi:hypothetical protein
MSTITCTSCGREQANTKIYCEMCGRELAQNGSSENSGASAAANGSVKADVPPVDTNASFIGVDGSAQAALNSARNFVSINRIVFILGIAGSILIAIFSLIPVCPPLDPGCWASDRKMYNFLSLFPLALGSLLSVLWLNGIAETIASRAALAAEVAKAQAK